MLNRQSTLSAKLYDAVYFSTSTTICISGKTKYGRIHKVVALRVRRSPQRVITVMSVTIILAELSRSCKHYNLCSEISHTTNITNIDIIKMENVLITKISEYLLLLSNLKKCKA